MNKGWWRRWRNGRMVCTLAGVLIAAAGDADAADSGREKATPSEEATFAGCKETKDTALPTHISGFGPGTDVADPGSLETTNFSHHIARLKLGYKF